MRYILYIVLFFAGSIYLAKNVYSQADNPDTLFLDTSPSTISGSVDEPTVDTSAKKTADNEKNREDTSQAPLYHPKPSFNFSFSLTSQNDSIVTQNNFIINSFIIPVTFLQGTILLDTALYFTGGPFFFNIDNRVFSQLRGNGEKIESMDLLTYVRNELFSTALGLSFWEKQITFKIGKLLNNTSVSFIATPSNPLVRVYGARLPWARDKIFPTISIQNISTASSYQEIGSGSVFLRGSRTRNKVGSWMVDFELALPWFVLRQAYLPKLELNIKEFDRPYHSFLTSFTLTYFSQVTPTITFFYDNNPFVGVALSANVGEYITFHFDSSVTFENKLPVLTKEGSTLMLSLSNNIPSISNYILERKDPNGVYFEGVLGLTTTPVKDGEALFSLLFEIYYNGHGLLDNEWDSYLSGVREIVGAYTTLNQYALSSIRDLSGAYKGLLGAIVSNYNPLKVRPLYLFLRFKKENVFSKVWKERIDILISLIYSPFDTTFAWNTEVEWLSNFLDVGMGFTYYFGRSRGTFTEIPSIFQYSIYTTVHFYK